MGFLNSLLSLFKNNNYETNNTSEVEEKVVEVPTYEDELLQQYGNVDEPNKKLNLRIMFIADTHDILYYRKEMQEFIKNEPNIDVYLLLGDHSGYDCDLLKKLIPNEKLFGIVGNHDSWERLSEAGITDINQKVIAVKGVRIAAISRKYQV